jgi:hypothetical protein
MTKDITNEQAKQKYAKLQLKIQKAVLAVNHSHQVQALGRSL